jgi:riboflavin kinase/FMN adenylyltransferase
MKVFRRLPPADERRPCALTIGNFDGVHLGHQAVLARLVANARERGLPACVLTFEPHPREYFAQSHASASPSATKDAAAPTVPMRILTERDKLDALADCGIDHVCIAHFNASLAAMTAEDFIADVLQEGLQARYLLIGDDFRFGARRRGDFDMLSAHAANHAFTLERMTTVAHEGERYSSSAVRRALAAGDLAQARTLLGRPYFISGHVIHGRKLGRTLGFPTLNIRVPFDNPAVSGIFIVQVHGLGERPLPAVASLGTRPAVESQGKLLLEVHVFDFNASVYGSLVRVEFLERLREERHYDNLDLLVEQIQLDARAARDHFGI